MAQVNVGDLVFIANKGWISKLIIWRSGQWSHEMFISNPFNRDVIEATYPEGVIQSNLSKYKGCKYAILTPIIPLTDKEKAEGLRFMASKIGSPYDKLGILSFILGRNVSNKNWYFCCEICGEAYETMKRFVIRKKPYWLVPDSHYESNDFRIIEEGVL